MIPARLVRCVPSETSPTVEAWWLRAVALHPGWEHVTLRDPLHPDDYPMTCDAWNRCESGAQLAGLVRLEDLYTYGGIYLDSDVEVFRSLDRLRRYRGFAAWEDETTVPDAVLGAEPGHPALRECLELALARIRSSSVDWRTGPGSWGTGPGVTTAVLPGRDDFVCLAAESFYPYHYTEKHRADEDHAANPNTYAAHHWHASWLRSEVESR